MSRLLRLWQNKLFCQNERKIYSELLAGKNEVYPSPNLVALGDFWRNIFESPVKQTWSLLGLMTSRTSLKISYMLWKNLLLMRFVLMVVCPCYPNGLLLVLMVSRVSGLNNLHTALKPVILSNFNTMLENGSHIPSWFPSGRTTMIPKASDATQPKNFCLITCLNVLYKLWTGCISELVLRHCAVNNVLHPTQKGCARGEPGCTDHLLLNS